MALPALKQSSLDLAHSGDHYSTLHNAPHGTVLLWEKANSNRWHKLEPGDAHIPALLAAQAGQPDRYLSVNEFHGWRLVKLLKSLRACYVDIDGHTNLEEALELLQDAKMPPPTAAVWSGRGLHLYWLHEPVPSQALPVWQRCQNALVAALAPLGADPAAKDCTRVLRLVGSVNSKNNAEVRGLILDPAPYNFHHLCDEVIGYREPKKAKEPARVLDLATAKANRGLRIYTGSIYDRWHLVYQDLLKIAEWHFLGGVPEHYRNNWLFLAAVSLSWFAHPKTLQKELEQQARVWTPGLLINEVRDAIKAPLERAAAATKGDTHHYNGIEEDPRYKFKRSTLLEWMQPIIPPELAPQLRAIVSDEIKAEHHAEAKRKHEATRDRVADGRHESHQAGRKGLGNPWEALGMSRATYFRKRSLGTI